MYLISNTANSMSSRVQNFQERPLMISRWQTLNINCELKTKKPAKCLLMETPKLITQHRLQVSETKVSRTTRNY